MGELIAIPLDGGGSVLVEAEGAGDGVVSAGRPRAGEALTKAASTLDALLEPVTAASRSMLRKLREAGPDEVEVQFGLKLTAEAGAVITRTSGECNVTVTLRWNRADEPGS